MATNAMPKRAHKTLSIDQKVKLVDQIDKKSYTVLCEEYGIGRSTISDIKKCEMEIRQYKRKLHEMGIQQPVKTIKLGDLDKAVFMWFKQKRDEGIPISNMFTI